MRRPESLAVPVAALAAVAVPLRSVHAFAPVRRIPGVDLVTLAVISRVAWSILAVAGFAAIGLAYGRRADERPRSVLVIATGSAFVGTLAGFLLLRLAGSAVWIDSWARELLTVGAYAVLDALLLAFVTLGGYALTIRDRGRPGR